MRLSCADPESFVRGGPTLTTFFFLFFQFSLMRGGKIQIPPFKRHLNGLSLGWRVDDCLILNANAGLVAL